MLVHVIASLIAFVSYGGIMALIFGHGLKNNRPAQLFSLYIACVMLMQMTYLMISLVDNADAAQFWYAFTVPLTAGQTTVYFFFTKAFLGLKQPRRTIRAGILVWFLAISILTLLRPDSIFTNIYRDETTGLFVPEITGAQVIFLSPIIVLWMVALFDLVGGARATRSSRQRVRIQYLLLSILLIWAGLVANTSSALRPYPIDVTANILAAFFIAYAILRHQLLDIHIVIRRGLIFTIPTLGLGVGYFLVIFLVTGLLDYWNKTNSLLVSLAVAIIVAAVVTPLRDRAQRWIEQAFFKGTFDNHLMLQRLNQKVVNILDFRELTRTILDDILETMHIEWAAFLVEQGGGFVPAVREEAEAKNELSLRGDHPIVSHLSTSGTAVTVDTLNDMLAKNVLSGEQFEDLQGAGVELWIPLRTREKLAGILALGRKQSTQGYTQEDELTLAALANQVAAAIDNARLYEALQQELRERKEIEHEREALINELKTKNDELERFTYTVSHDLKAPLITIRGFLGYLEEDARKGNTERLKKDINRIVDATDKMQNLLNDLLELSRIGRMMNPSERVMFADIAQEAIALVRGQIEAGGVRIDLDPDLPAVFGDRLRLVEVVQNLLDNACKFMGSQAEPRIQIGQHGVDEAGHPIFYVRDNGIGIEAQHRERIFELFHKLDAHSEGTGIGLALVKRIVEVHGGTIRVESPGPGGGTCFYFSLPGKA